MSKSYEVRSGKDNGAKAVCIREFDGDDEEYMFIPIGQVESVANRMIALAEHLTQQHSNRSP